MIGEGLVCCRAGPFEEIPLDLDIVFTELFLQHTSRVGGGNVGPPTCGLPPTPVPEKAMRIVAGASAAAAVSICRWLAATTKTKVRLTSSAEKCLGSK